MSFGQEFTNPFQDAATVPLQYRQHAALQKLFKTDGSYSRPAEDPVTLWAIDLLVREYGVPLDTMELELYADFSEGTYQGGRRYQGRADVVIYDDRYAAGDMDVAFIMVEAMEPGKKFEGNDPEGWVEHLNRLNAYMSASPSARYAILTSGHHTSFTAATLNIRVSWSRSVTCPSMRARDKPHNTAPTKSSPTPTSRMASRPACSR
jgi:type I restriction enzyme M protein